MFVILLFFALIRTLRGVPLSSPLADSNGFPDLVLRGASFHFGERAISDIILSCFATIFACTWSAVHPNIPAPTDCAWTRLKRQVLTMVYALLAPEAITAWALRQRLAAGTVMDEYNNEKWVVRNDGTETSKSNFILDKIRATFHDSPLPSKLQDGQVPEWTLAHGFFLQMGGFMLSEGGQPIQILTGSYFDRPAIKDLAKMSIRWNIENKIIDPPQTTEEDIQDRSKGDAISKTLIILQTTWFIVQCIARWSNRLPVTELEVVTLGFAILNGITYGLWWHKPQNVCRPVFLEIKRQPEESSSDSHEKSGSPKTTRPGPTSTSDGPETRTPESNRMSNTSGNLEIPNEETETKPGPTKESYGYLRRKFRKDMQEYASSAMPWKLLYLIPLHLIVCLLRPLAKLAEYREAYMPVEFGDLRVPMFYSTGKIGDTQVFGLTTLIGILFGSIHFITSWFLDFASMQEMWLWRLSALVITVGPAFLSIWQYSDDKNWRYFWYNIFRAITIGMIPLYIISRIILLTLALTSLRALPHAALQTIDWTTFIPHL